MHTAAQFKQDLMKLGLRSGDTVMIHSSYKALGGIEGGAAAVFGTLQELLGPEGTLVIPAFSWETVNAQQPVFDRETTPGCVGYLPEYFRREVPGVIRSIHATHSCCLWGKRAEELAKDHELDDSPVGSNSPIVKLKEIGGKILLLGCPFDRITFMHGVEETVDAEYLLQPDKLEYVLYDGKGWREVELKGSWFPEAFIGTMGGLMKKAEDPSYYYMNSVDEAYKTMCVVEACYKSNETAMTQVDYQR